MKLRAVVLTAVTALASAHAAQASNVVIDMSQVEDYTQYQTDLQQCEGLVSASLPRLAGIAGIGAKPVPMPARKPTKLSKTVWPGEATTF